MTLSPDLRGSLAQVRSTLQSDPLDPAAVESCVSQLSSIGSEISTAISEQFLVLVESAELNAA